MTSKVVTGFVYDPKYLPFVFMVLSANRKYGIKAGIPIPQ